MSSPVSPIATPEERAKCDSAIARWAEATAGDGVLAVDRDPELARWYIRLKGDEKDVVTIWLTIRQRTLRHETHFMPAPETNVCETYQYLLRRNSALRGMRFSLGDEDAVYLVGELPVAAVTEDEIDRIVGTSLEYVDECFPAAMTLGYASIYRRRPRRS
jgi:hypothetical protein